MKYIADTFKNRTGPGLHRVSLFLLSFLLMLLSSLSADKAVFVNRYMEKNILLTEEVILTAESYNKRERHIHQIGSLYYVRPDTLLTIYPENHLGGKVFVKSKGKAFLSPFYIFATSRNIRLEIGNETNTLFLDIIIDKEPPAIKLLPNTVSPAVDKIIFYPSAPLNLWFTDSGAGLKNTSYRLDEGKWTPYREPLTPAAANKKLEVQAEDRLGQVNKKTFVLIPDTAWPETELLLPEEKNITYLLKENEISFYADSLPVEITARDNYAATPHIFYSLNGKNWVNYTAPLRILTNCVLSFYATDDIGNTAPVKDYYFRKERQKPLILPH